MNEETERIKRIIEEELEREFNMGRLRPSSRWQHIKEHIFFKIDNPDYARKERN